jgi:hypothetical protein
MSADRRESFAIIPSRPRSIDRFVLLERCLTATSPQVDRVFLIDNTTGGVIGKNPVPRPLSNVTIIHEPVDPVNLSYLWNVGIKRAEAESEGPQWDVAILNDDAIVPAGWFDAVSSRMRMLNAAAACSGGRRNFPHLHHHPTRVPLETRMTGWAFILAGEKGARANEQLKWWFGDDHLDWLSRQLGGMVMIPGFHVEHLTANNQMTPELHQQTGEDAAAFKAYWGDTPW